MPVFSNPQIILIYTMEVCFIEVLLYISMSDTFFFLAECYELLLTCLTPVNECILSFTRHMYTDS